jgi:hypothetical protein
MPIMLGSVDTGLIFQVVLNKSFHIPEFQIYDLMCKVYKSIVVLLNVGFLSQSRRNNIPKNRKTNISFWFWSFVSLLNGRKYICVSWVFTSSLFVVCKAVILPVYQCNISYIK